MSADNVRRQARRIMELTEEVERLRAELERIERYRAKRRAQYAKRQGAIESVKLTVDSNLRMVVTQ